MARLYTVRKRKIGRTEQMDALARAAGELYSQVVVWFWRTVRHKDLWLKAKHLMRWLACALQRCRGAILLCCARQLACPAQRGSRCPSAAQAQALLSRAVERGRHQD